MAGLHRYYKIWNKCFKPIDALNCGIGGDKVQNVLWRVQNLPISSSLKTASFCAYQQFTTGFSREYLLMALLRLDIVLKDGTITLIFFICTSINRVYVIETNKILKVKCSLNKLFFIIKILIGLNQMAA